MMISLKLNAFMEKYWSFYNYKNPANTKSEDMKDMKEMFVDLPFRDQMFVLTNCDQGLTKNMPIENPKLKLMLL